MFVGNRKVIMATHPPTLNEPAATEHSHTGMVRRTMHAEVPPRVEYELPSIGRTLIEPARELSRWAMSSYPTILDSGEQFDAANSAPKYARSSDL
jgi:hypothetical protein